MILLLVLPLQFPNNAVEQNPTQDTYCNERFQFCSQFPSETFPTQIDFHEGDGLLLRTENELATVIIAGYRDFAGETTREIHVKEVEKLAAPDERSVLISSVFGEDFYECFFMVGKRSFFHKTYLFDDHIVRLSIETTINQPKLMQELRDSVTLYFQDGKELPEGTSSVMGRE
jgi:hypothetical protein